MKSGVPDSMVPVVDGKKLPALEINTNYRGRSDEATARQRPGEWVVTNRDGGNELELRIAFGDGEPVLVGRLVRDDALSAYRWQDPGGVPKFLFGAYDRVEITGLRSHDVKTGVSEATVTWKYVVAFDRLSGAPFNFLKDGESAAEPIHFLSRKPVQETGSGDETTRRETKETVTFTLKGTNDRPFILQADTRATSPDDEFPTVTPGPVDPTNWPWWKTTSLIEMTPNGTLSHGQKAINSRGFSSYVVKDEVSADDPVAWRFVPVDEDGDYTVTDRTAFNAGQFIETHLSLRSIGGTLDPRSPVHEVFEIVQAVDTDGVPRFVEVPGRAGEWLPVIEVRLRDDLPETLQPTYHFSLFLAGGGQIASGFNHVRQMLSVSLNLNTRPPTLARSADLTLDENLTDTGHDVTIGGLPDTVTRTQWALSGDDAARFTLVGNPGSLTRRLKFVTKPDFERPADTNTDNIYDVTITVTTFDKLYNRQVVSQTVTVEVENFNEAPVAHSSTRNRADEDTPVRLTRGVFRFRDPDNPHSLLNHDVDDLTLVITGLSGQEGGATLSWNGAVHDFTGGSLEIEASSLLNSSDDRLVLTPAADSSEPLALTYRVKDQAGQESRDATVSIPFNPAPDRPTATPPPQTPLKETETRDLKLSDFGFHDVDGEELYMVVITGITNGELWSGNSKIHDASTDTPTVIMSHDVERLVLKPAHADKTDFNGAPGDITVSYYLFSKSVTRLVTQIASSEPQSDMETLLNRLLAADDADSHRSVEQRLSVPVIDVHDMAPVFAEPVPHLGAEGE